MYLMEFRKTTPCSATKVTETFIFHPRCQGGHMFDNDNMDFPALPPFGEEQRKVSGTARVLGECDHPPHPTAITRAWATGQRFSTLWSISQCSLGKCTPYF